ncbi:MAG: MerR family DNA-binding protein [Alphaproteobacteria bacterium]
MRAMTIGRAAREAGVGVETVRFYERRGLIEQPSKPTSSGFRIYPAETIERIRFIRQAQELGFSLREVCELLELRADPQADAADVQTKTAAKLTDIDAKMGQLQRIKDALQTLLAACPGQGTLGCCSIMEALEGHGEPGTSERRRSSRRQR